MRYIQFFLLFLVVSFTFGQDAISPLASNPDLMKDKKAQIKSLADSFDSTIVYITDTLGLPFFDDFSRDNFQTYTSKIGDSGLEEEIYYRMISEIDESPLLLNTRLTETKTYRSIYDADLGETSIVYFDSIRFLYDDLKHFSPEYTPKYGYPAFYLYDTINGGDGEQDTVWVEEIDFIQDSARIFISTLNTPTKLWLNRQAYHNYRLAKNPWSLGIVSFDGLDEYGYPYQFNSVVNGTADTLKAKPIDMSTNSPSDSVYFSFLYQTEGFGDAPEDNDSLYVEFFSPITQMWKRVWRVSGASTGDFKVAHFPIVDPDYFAKGFQFRFINYGSLAGALDYFHIDYVHLRPFSGRPDTLFKDFAMVYPISTLLKDYTSVPWKHYQAHPDNKMGDSVLVTVRNGSELTENNQNGRVSVYYKGNLEGEVTLNAATLSGGDINYSPRTTYGSYHDFSTSYSFNPNIDSDTLAIFDYIGAATAQFPNDPINDTAFGQQIFKNYYAYDDGSAEKAYGVTGEQSLLAIQFKAYQPDSLVAVDIHFVPTVNNVENNLFILTIWGDNDGRPGEIIYEDDFFLPQQPAYLYGKNKFKTYFFKDSMKVAVDEVFYVGMRQVEEQRLNIGFDMNHDNADKIFWSVNAGGTWNNANFPGTVMIRPIVTSVLDYSLGISNEKLNPKTDYSFVLYPNPAANILNIDTKEVTATTSFSIIDLNGRTIKQLDSGVTSVDVSSLQKGIYLVNRLENKQRVKTQKLVIR